MRPRLLGFVVILAFCTLSNVRGACSRTGVGGRWNGEGTIVLTATGQKIPFTFRDTFHVSEKQLKGHMIFESAGPVPVPPILDDILSESYVVEFAEGETIDFQSNWGRGSGFWGEQTYTLDFRDFTRAIHVVERGTIVSCDRLRVIGDVFVLGAKMARTFIEYHRP